jgi:predicted small lipoprotein YifL
MSRLLMIMLAASLAACGMRGSLELPPVAPPEPLLGTPKPAPAKSSRPIEPREDVSTDEKPRTE